MFYSPLRYPGGKNKLSAFIARICLDNNINGHYVEPYCGGASVALFLLMEGLVEKITINDKDKSLYAFWSAVLNNTEELCERIENTVFTIEEWRKQKEFQKAKDSDNISLLELGYSTLYLNRTNRSGILNAGVIGGVDQSGNYKMDCRFNTADIKNKIKKIASFKNSIRLFDLDAIELIDKIEQENTDSNTIFYFDPPYYLKASSLYMSHYKDSDHAEVSERIKSIENIQWIVSYDNVPEIQELYNECQKKEYGFFHTAFNDKKELKGKRKGKEILFFSDSLKQPEVASEGWNPTQFKYNNGVSTYTGNKKISLFTD